MFHLNSWICAFSDRPEENLRVETKNGRKRRVAKHSQTQAFSYVLPRGDFSIFRLNPRFSSGRSEKAQIQELR